MENESNSFKTTILDLIQTFAVALAICLVIYYFLVQPHRVDGQSMEPNFHNGDLILSDKISYRFSQPKRGNVIVFQAPQSPDKDFIKRIIGLPKERIRISNGKVYINDTPLDEPYLSDPTGTEGSTTIKENEEYLVPVDQYVVMGDNRKHSSDSRSWGTISKSEVIGKIWLRYWPTSKFQFIPKIRYQSTIPE